MYIEIKNKKTERKIVIDLKNGELLCPEHLLGAKCIGFLSKNNEITSREKIAQTKNDEIINYRPIIENEKNTTVLEIDSGCSYRIYDLV